MTPVFFKLNVFYHVQYKAQKAILKKHIQIQSLNLGNARIKMLYTIPNFWVRDWILF